MKNSVNVRFLIFFASGCLLGMSAVADWYDPSWLFRDEITISSDVTPSDLSNFPVLITLDNETHQVFGESQPDGDDILFTAIDGVTKLPHEIETYSGVSGQEELVTWVMQPMLSASVDTTIYMYYGNASCISQENPNAVWDPSFHMVQHLGETSGTHFDSTTYGNNGNPSGGVNQNASGQINGADSFDGLDDSVVFLDDSSLNFGTGPFTVTLWSTGMFSPISSLISKGPGFDSTHNAGWGLTFPSTPYNLYVLVGNGSTHIEYQTSLGNINDWTYIGLSRDTEDNIYFILDGNVIDTNLDLSGSVDSPVDVTLGTNDLYGDFYNGSIDEVRVASVFKSPDWIAAEYNMTSNANNYITFDSLTLPTATPTPPCLNHGDVNLSRSITAADAQLAFFCVLGLYTPTFEEACAADCNGDESITAGDAQLIFYSVLGTGTCVDPTPVPTGTVYIPPGTFYMGASSDEPCSGSDERPVHEVSFTRGYNIMKTEVTRQMWADLKAHQPTLPDDPSLTQYSPTMNHPVLYITWNESVLFANLLSIQKGLTPAYYKDETFTLPVDATNYISGLFYCNFDAPGYRLPTESEWEYACRAGTDGPFSCDEVNYTSETCGSPNCVNGEFPLLEQHAVFCANDPGTADTCGSKQPNPLGLYDMHGNVWEWCWDWYASDYYGVSPIDDPTGPTSGNYRTIRSGHWDYSAQNCRSADRDYGFPHIPDNPLGFRLVQTID